MWNEHLGYILTCPSNLGTGLRAGVHVTLPRLSKVLALEIYYYFFFSYLDYAMLIILHLVGHMHGNVNAFLCIFICITYECILIQYFFGVRLTHIYVVTCVLCI